MKLRNVMSLFGLACLSFAAPLSADTLVDSEKFNVTLNLAAAHYLKVSDLDFGYINPVSVTEDDIYESTTGSITAYANGISGHYVQLEAADAQYLSEDKSTFLMRSISEPNESISFLLNSSYEVDGSKAKEGQRTLRPGDVMIKADGSDANHKVVRDIWASLSRPEQLKTASAGKYLGVVVANHYTND